MPNSDACPTCDEKFMYRLKLATQWLFAGILVAAFVELEANAQDPASNGESPMSYVTGFSLEGSQVGSTELIMGASYQFEGSSAPITHTVTIFAASADPDDDDFKVGVEYGMTLNDYLGVGLLAEHTSASDSGFKSSMAMAVLQAFPFEEVQFTVGIGREWAGGTEVQSNSLYRIGLAYTFSIGRLTITPLIDVDFAQGGQSVVSGILMSHQF